MPANTPLRLEMPFEGQDDTNELRLTAMPTSVASSSVHTTTAGTAQRPSTSASVQSRMDRLLQKLTSGNTSTASNSSGNVVAVPQSVVHTRQPRTTDTAGAELHVMRHTPTSTTDASRRKLPPRHNAQQPVSSTTTCPTPSTAPPLPRLAGHTRTALPSKQSDTTVNVSTIAPVELSASAELLSASLGSVPPRRANTGSHNVSSMRGPTRVTEKSTLDSVQGVAVAPPPVSPGLAGLLCVAEEVWHELGFFASPPHLQQQQQETSHDTRRRGGGDEGAVVGSATQTMYSCFVHSVTQLYSVGVGHHTRVTTTQQAVHEDEGSECTIARNVVWHVLYNALCYCDANCMPTLTSKEDSGTTERARTTLPVRLTWRTTAHVHSEENDRHFSTTREAPMQPPLSDASTHRLLQRQILPAALWVFCLRTLARLGYGRDLFYLQTPCDASPHELLLALLWLTRRCELVALAAFVRVNGSHRYLLRYHTPAEDIIDDNEKTPRPHGTTPSSIASATSTSARVLSAAFPQAMMWPPLSFDEDRVIAYRLRQIDDIVTQPEIDNTCDDASRVISTLTRRVMALRRLVTLALNRLEQSLVQHTAQVTALGLHSVLDAQLCQSSQHASYAEVMEGLELLSGLEARLQRQLTSLTAAATLVAEAIDADMQGMTCLAPEQLQHALDADEATWQQRIHTTPPQADAKEGTALDETPMLSSVLSKFRATRTRDTLHDLWRSLQRRQHASTKDIASKYSGGMEDTSTPLEPNNESGSRGQGNVSVTSLDTQAQASAVACVRRNVRAQYTLQAALAAELTLIARQPRQGGQARVRLVRPSPPLLLCTKCDATACATIAGSTMLQVTAVGQPGAHETTSARLELERLAGVMQGITSQSSAQAQQAARLQRCAALLDELKAVYGLRPILTATHRSNTF